jgi:hypothetical protein
MHPLYDHAEREQAMIQRDQLELLLAAVAGAGLGGVAGIVLGHEELGITYLGTRRRSRCEWGGVFLLVLSSSLAPMPSSPRHGMVTRVTDVPCNV